jgi:hypothetical protein
MRTPLAILLALALPLVGMAGQGEDAPADAPWIRLIVEVVEPDGTHVQRNGQITHSFEDAAVEARRVHRMGLCVPVPTAPPTDPDLIGLCYPPAQIVRIRILECTVPTCGQ